MEAVVEVLDRDGDRHGEGPTEQEQRLDVQATDLRQASDGILTRFRQGFDSICTFQWKRRSKAHEPLPPVAPPMGPRVGFMGVKEHEFPRNGLGIVETGSPKSRSPATGLRPGFASSRVIRCHPNSFDRFVTGKFPYPG